jgi:hypothetical protein
VRLTVRTSLPGSRAGDEEPLGDLSVGQAAARGRRRPKNHGDGSHVRGVPVVCRVRAARGASPSASLPEISHKDGKAMPIVPYYLGHPASTWLKVMSCPVRASAANPTTATASSVTRQPVTPVAQRKAPAETTAHATACASAWAAWAANWFTPARPVDLGSHLTGQRP